MFISSGSSPDVTSDAGGGGAGSNFVSSSGSNELSNTIAANGKAEFMKKLRAIMAK